MIERDLERRLHRWYADVTTDPASAALRDRVWDIPDRPASRGRLGSLGRSRRTLLLAAALLLATAAAAGAIGSGQLRLPNVAEREALAPETIDACALFERAIERAGQKPGTLASGHHAPTRYGATVCVNDDWDSGWDWRHLIWHPAPTSSDEVPARLEDLAQEIRSDVRYDCAGWTAVDARTWRGTCIGREDETGGRYPDFLVIAVDRHPYFFAVTGRTLGQLGKTGGQQQVQDLAEAVEAELALMEASR